MTTDKLQAKIVRLNFSMMNRWNVEMVVGGETSLRAEDSLMNRSNTRMITKAQVIDRSSIRRSCEKLDTVIVFNRYQRI